MRFETDHLIYKALCALDEAATECEPSPIKRTYALRFVLAYLYAAGNGERWLFERFWQAIGDPQANAYSEAMGRYMRGNAAKTSVWGIARSVGYPETPEALQRLHMWRKDSPTAPISINVEPPPPASESATTKERMRHKPKRGDCGWL